MATERLPWFTVHLVLEGEEVKEAFLVHIDERRVTDALRWLRQREVGLSVGRTMALVPCSEDRLTAPWWRSFQSKLLRHLGSSQDAYAAAKVAWVKESGYDGARNELSIDVSVRENEDPLDLLADWVVGLTSELPIRALRVVERRFGIDKLVQELRDVAGLLKIDRMPPVATATVTIASADNSERVVINTEVRVASLYVKWLAPKYERLHFAGNGLSLIMIPVASTSDTSPLQFALRARFSLPWESQQAPLTDIVRIGKALRLLATGDGPPAQVRFQAPGVLDLPTPVRTNLRLEPRGRRFIAVVERAASVARYFEVRADVIVDPGDLLEDAVDVFLLAAGLDRTTNDLDVMSIPYEGEGAQGKTVTVIFTPTFALADELLGGVIGLVGQAECGGGKLTVRTPAVRCFSKFIGSDVEWDESVRSRLGDAVTQLVSEGFTDSTIFRPRVEGDDEVSE